MHVHTLVLPFSSEKEGFKLSEMMNLPAYFTACGWEKPCTERIKIDIPC